MHHKGTVRTGPVETTTRWETMRGAHECVYMGYRSRTAGSGARSTTGELFPLACCCAEPRSSVVLIDFGAALCLLVSYRSLGKFLVGFLFALNEASCDGCNDR